LPSSQLMNPMIRQFGTPFCIYPEPETKSSAPKLVMINSSFLGVDGSRWSISNYVGGAKLNFYLGITTRLGPFVHPFATRLFSKSTDTSRHEVSLKVESRSCIFSHTSITVRETGALILHLVSLSHLCSQLASDNSEEKRHPVSDCDKLHVCIFQFQVSLLWYSNVPLFFSGIFYKRERMCLAVAIRLWHNKRPNYDVQFVHFSSRIVSPNCSRL
jgi:hypothetical protein